MQDLLLFVRPTCPYCRKVDRFLAREGIEVPHANIVADPERYVELVGKGGMDQVPCLRIDGHYLYESDDIIAWFKQHED